MDTGPVPEPPELDFDAVAAALAHELRSPLNKVLAFARLLAVEVPEELSAEATESLTHLVGAAGEARDVVDAYHEWARSGTAHPAHEVDLGACVQRALRGVPAPSSAEVEIGVLPTIQGDSSALERLFGHLLGNALLYVEAGATPRVRVEAESSGAGWLVAVSDGGIGVPEHERRRVLQPFVRLHGRARFPGIGLGLAIASRVAAAHGGSVWLEGSPLGGTRACVLLGASHTEGR